VEDEEVGIVQQRSAEGESLQHSARVRRRACMPLLPEAEAFEQHADPFPPLANAIQTPVEIEVLECGELAVDEGLMREEANAGTWDVIGELACGRQGEPGAESQERGLPGAVWARDEQEAVE